MKPVAAIYATRGFKIDTAFMDGEFLPLCGDLASMDINLNCTFADEHVPEIERQIRVIKEKTRAGHHTLPFDCIPKLMVM